MLLKTYATSVVIGSRIDGSSFSGLLTRVDIGPIQSMLSELVDQLSSVNLLLTGGLFS